MASEREDNSPRPERNRHKSVALLLPGVLVVACLALGALCWFFGIRSPVVDIAAYRAMSREHYHSLWKDLAWRRFKPGDDLARLVAKHPPLRVETFGGYTSLSYWPNESSHVLHVTAKDRRLVHAYAAGSEWRHTFFGDATEEEAFNRAYNDYSKRRQRERDVFRIHRAITAGQVVFGASRIERRDASAESDEQQEMMEQLRQIYGDRYTQTMFGELAVEVGDVLYGDVEPGTVLTLPEGNPHLGTDDTVFVYLEDDRLFNLHAKGEPACVPLERSALAEYQALTPEQVQDLEARWTEPYR